MLSSRILALTLLPAIVIMGCLGANELGLREEAKDAAAKSGQACIALSDPTTGANPMLEEHRLLRGADPEDETYFHTHQVLVTSLPGSIYRGCLGRSISSNPVGTNFIFLNLDRLNTPALRATALSHELIHVQHGDHTSTLGKHTFVDHLWRPEEAEAHLRGLQTAQTLHSLPMYPVWQDRVVWIDTLPLFYSLVGVDIFLFALTIRTKQRDRSPRRLKKPLAKETRPSLLT